MMQLKLLKMKRFSRVLFIMFPSWMLVSNTDIGSECFSLYLFIFKLCSLNG